MERRVDKLEAIDRRVTKLQASKAVYRRYSSNYDIAPYQQPTRFRPCHEQPPGWPPLQRSPPSCWPAQRRRHASERQQQTHAYRKQHEPVVAHMEPLNWFSNSPAATTQSRSCHEQPTVVLQPLLRPTSLQCSPIPPTASAAVPPPSSHLPSTRPTTQLVSCEEMHLGVEGDSQVLNQGDLQLNGMKLVDEELCYETELIIPIHHSSSLDQELDAHHKTEENSSLNWMCSFLDEVDESKSSLLNDNHDKATCDNDEFTEMECHSVKISDESDLQGDSSQQKYLDSDDDYEDDRVDGEGRRSHNITTAELPRLKVLVQRFMEDKQFGGRRTDADVGSRCMIRNLLQVPAIKDDFVKTKAREERDGVEMMIENAEEGSSAIASNRGCR
ncbi:hypothetical protein SASPL_147452 [Salvia splendens]|uniref:Uncharacterized protein n=1 Tax=Salvia splendens TaxID=180675 RepID=A0A8X8WEI2_SALSN|nr:hypothetical protein SASPL_147452 [Salvia splendens]